MSSPSFGDYILACATVVSGGEGVAKMDMPETISDMIPEFLTDVQQFIKIAAAVRNPYFNVPRVMTHSRFSYILTELSRLTQNMSILQLDPARGIVTSSTATKDTLNSLDSTHFADLDNLCVLTLCNTAEELKNLPLSASSNMCHTHNDIFVVKTTHGLYHGWVKYVRFTCIDSEFSRTTLVRELAARSTSLPARASIALGDPSIPLCVIPTVTSLHLLYTVAHGSPVIMYPGS